MSGTGKNRITAVLLCILMVFPTFVLSYAEDDEEKTPDRTETVYINADASGNVESVLSSVYIVNAKGEEMLSDPSNLTDVKNVSSTESPELTDKGWTFKTDGDDLCYQGTADVAGLPVTMKVVYSLDGKQMRPEDMAGESGHVKITVSYQNLDKHETKVDGELVELYTPFTVITLITLDDAFKKVAVDNAKLITDAGATTILGTTFPGLAKSLDAEAKDSLSESFSIEADTKAFSMDSMTVIIIPNLVSSDDLNSLDDLQDFIDGVDELNDAGEKLQKGGRIIYFGVREFVAGLDSYVGAISSLRSGLSSIITVIRSKDDSISSQLGQLKSGLRGILNAIDGANSALSTVSGIAEVETAKGYLSQASGGLSGIIDNIPSFSLGELASELEKIEAGLASFQSNGNDLVSGGVSLRKGAWSLYKGLREFCDEGLQELEEQTQDLSVSVDRKDAILELGEKYLSYSSDEVENGSVKFMITTDNVYIPKVTSTSPTSSPESEQADQTTVTEEQGTVTEEVWDRLKEFFGTIVSGIRK